MTTGEPWNPEPYRWLFEDVGGSRVPVINCTGGTEVGACFLSPTPVGPIKACSVGGPALGMAMDVVDDDGQLARRHRRGRRARLPQAVPRHDARLLARPGASYIETYWSRIPGVWVHGDWASVDADGYWFLHGRSDDTLNIAGKRIGPAELESAAVGHPAVREAAAIGVPHEVKGETAWIFCCLLPGAEATEADVAAHVAGRARQGVQAGPRLLRRRAAEDALGEDRAARGARRRRSAPIRVTCRRSRTRSRSRRSRRRCAERRAHHRRRPRHRREHRARARGDGWDGRRHRALARRDRRGRGRDRRTRARARRRLGRESVERVFGEIGDVDLLVANAGRHRRPATGSSPDDWWRTFEVNVLGVHLCCRAAIPRMLERGAGRIVITGSGAVVPARRDDDGVQRVEGRGRPVRGDAAQRARGGSPCSSSRPASCAPR